MNAYTEFVLNRNEKAALAIKDINEAKSTLEMLERCALDIANGRRWDVCEIATTTHRLRNFVDSILANLVLAHTLEERK